MALLKTAVILFNLGGPDSAAAIEPFLFNFFTDKNIIRLPALARYPLAKLIAKRRGGREAGTAYGLLGGKSPLLENSRAQADALEKALGERVKVFVCMRYWHPMADEVAAQVKKFAPERIVLLPLYPQFSTTTTRSSLQEWDRAAKKTGLDVAAEMICCYPLHDGFISASAQNIRTAYEAAQTKTGRSPRILFSAHGLPEKVIADGDPYQWQCEESAAAIARAAGLQDADWMICYQSRVGPMKWIGPSTDEAIRLAGADKVPVVIYPHAFTQEHVETLVEIEIEYRHLAEQSGVPYFARVPTVGVHPAFIEGLAQLVRKGENDRICPASFRRCCRETQKKEAA